MFPKRFKRYIRKLTYALTNQLDQFLCYGDSITPQETYESLLNSMRSGHEAWFAEMIQNPVLPANPHIELHQEQENARQDYDDTIDAMAQAFNVIGFPTYEGKFKKKVPLMDRKYPHKCYECKKDLEYRHAYKSACGVYDHPYLIIRKGTYLTSKDWQMKMAREGYAFEKQFKKWWKSPIVKFMCCTCYRKVTQPNKQPTTYITHGEYIIESEPPEMDEHIDFSGGVTHFRSHLSFSWNDDLPIDNYDNHEEP